MQREPELPELAMRCVMRAQSGRGMAWLTSHVEKLGGFNTEFLGQFGVDQLGDIDKITSMGNKNK